MSAEHKVIRVNTLANIIAKKIRGQPNNEGGPEQFNRFLEERLDQLAQEGWELVAADGQRFYLRRSTETK